MVALLLHDALVEDDDDVTVADGGQPVGDGDGGPVPGRRVEGPLHAPLAGRVQGRRGLVQQQHSRVVDQSPCNGCTKKCQQR